MDGIVCKSPVPLTKMLTVLATFAARNISAIHLNSGSLLSPASYKILLSKWMSLYTLRGFRSLNFKILWRCTMELTITKYEWLNLHYFRSLYDLNYLQRQGIFILLNTYQVRRCTIFLPLIEFTVSEKRIDNSDYDLGAKYLWISVI